MRVSLFRKKVNLEEDGVVKKRSQSKVLWASKKVCDARHGKRGENSNYKLRAGEKKRTMPALKTMAGASKGIETLEQRLARTSGEREGGGQSVQKKRLDRKSEGLKDNNARARNKSQKQKRGSNRREEEI